MCVALSPPSQHSEGKYIVVNILDGGKVCHTHADIEKFQLRHLCIEDTQPTHT